MNRREKRQLQILLGELRNGTDIESAAVVAEMSLRSAVDHMRAEERGEYADIVHIQRILVFDGGRLVAPPHHTGGESTRGRSRIEDWRPM